jgi:hypothetical protein
MFRLSYYNHPSVRTQDTETERNAQSTYRRRHRSDGHEVTSPHTTATGRSMSKHLSDGEIGVLEIGGRQMLHLFIFACHNKISKRNLSEAKLKYSRAR